MNEWFNGKVAMVTGAGSGIGLAGAAVVLVDRKAGSGACRGIGTDRW